MSFIDNAMEVLDQAEASLHSVIADALAAKSYKEIATIAAMAEAVAAINAGRPPGRTTDWPVRTGSQSGRCLVER